MGGDSIDTVFLLVAIVVFLVVALRSDWFIKVASYGRRSIRDLSGFESRLLFTMRIMGVVGAIWCIGLIVWRLISHR